MTVGLISGWLFHRLNDGISITHLLHLIWRRGCRMMSSRNHIGMTSPVLPGQPTPMFTFTIPSVPSPHITRSITHRRRSLSSTLNGVSPLPLIRLSLFLRWRQNSQGPPPARRSPCPDMSLQNRVLASRSTTVSSTNRQRRAKSEEIRTVER